MMKLNFVREFLTKYMGTTIIVRTDTNSPPMVCTLLQHKHDVDEGKPAFEKYLEVRVNLYTKDGKVEETYIDLGKYILDVFVPASGFYNVDKTVIYVNNTYRKQWKRAGISGNTIGASLFKEQLGRYRLPNEELAAIGLSILNGRFTSIEDSIQCVESGSRVYAAFSEDYCVGLSENIKDVIVLMYKNIIIGAIDKNKEDYLIRLPKKGIHFKEDLEQYLPVEVL